jgi:ElaB/YqjD/DUF883 family membrane-anchored ribosome-binding protein
MLTFGKKGRDGFREGESIDFVSEERIVMSANGTSAERLVSDLKLVMRDAEDILKTTAGEVGDRTTEVRARLSEKLRAAQEKCRELEAKTIEAAKATDKLIHENPYPAMGIAAGVGLLVGFLVAKNKS